MKTKILTAGLLAAIILFTYTSCDLFGKKGATNKKATIFGPWKVKHVTDSSKEHPNNLGTTLLAISSNDSTPLLLRFRTDSSLIYLKDTAKFYVDSAYTTVFVKSDSSTEAYSIKEFTDTSLWLYNSKDSVLIALGKK